KRAKELLFGGRQERVIKIFLRNLESGEERVRRNAILGLSKIDSPLAVTALRKIAFGREVNLSIAAIRGLGWLKDKGCLDGLSALINNPNAESSQRKVAELVYQEIVETSFQEKQSE
ncbi:HEAT repeat domain-containing protein, partial [Planctomycetota bacterium]